MKRRFGLPIAVALAVHALVLFGFRTPVRAPVAMVVPRPDTTHVVQVDTPVDLTNASDENQPSSPVQKSEEQSNPDPVVTRTDASLSPVEITATDFDTSNSYRPVEQGTFGPVGKGIGTDNIGPVIDQRHLDHAPKARVQAPPVYPFEAKAAGLTGTVIVEFVVDKTGRVLDANVVRSTNSVFDEETLRAVSHWRFEPGRLHGRLVSFRMAVPVQFNLDAN